MVIMGQTKFNSPITKRLKSTLMRTGMAETCYNALKISEISRCLTTFNHALLDFMGSKIAHTYPFVYYDADSRTLRISDIKIDDLY